MATETPVPPAEEQVAATQLEGQTYEIIRKRLADAGGRLRQRVSQLNDARKEVFGAIETELLSTQRVTTENNCVARDMVAVGSGFLFGYNVHIGLRSETKLSDVFAAYDVREGEFHQQPLDGISDERFEKDFRDLYKFYRHTQFAKFHRLGPHLYMVFRVGKDVGDVKTFKWAVDGGQLHYLDNRSDHEYRFPAQHEFEWKATVREQHRGGPHPHISIEDRVFVETVGGDLTIKIEDNTNSGKGILSEPVDDPDQTLDDADIRYAVVGNLILLKVLPYREQQHRYFVFNEKIGTAQRLDGIRDACVLLPDDHGVIFSNGYYLQSGECKTFDLDVSDLVYTNQIRSSNGEDFLYIFYHRISGTYVMLSYNLIAQQVSTPTVCNGYAHFSDGRMITFRHQDEPQKHHAVQIWQTPYTGQDYLPETQTDSLLYRIGNRELVRAMAECHGVLNLLGKDDTYGDLYIDIVKQTTDILDSYFWLDQDEAFGLHEVLGEIRDTAAGAINEFEKVVRVRRATREAVQRVTGQVNDAVSAVHAERFDQIGGFVRSLAQLRAVRGEVISLGDLRYVDMAVVDRLESTVGEHTAQLSSRCVEFLLEPDSLAPYQARIEQQHARIPELPKVADARELAEKVDAAADELEMLIEIVSNLKIDDATQRTEIIDNISAIFSRLNQTRAALKNKTRQLMAEEGAAEFHSQLKLLNQAVTNYLDVCEVPEHCEEYLTKTMIQVEELEGRFAEFDDFIEQLAEKRDEIYNAFETRRLQLVETRNRRAATLMRSAERILKGCQSRVEKLQSVAEINGYFASDLMIEKVRDIVDQLGELGDSVKVDDVLSRLKTIQQDAIRQLKDRQDLYLDGENVIQFGRHRFSVNTQPIDLTTVYRDGTLCYHLTGTGFFEAVDDPELQATHPVWDQQVVSENADVYRAEYLAYRMLKQLGCDDLPSPTELHRQSDQQQRAVVQRFMAPRYSEGYVKGVHDHDAAQILAALVELHLALGPLRYSSQARALGWLLWKVWIEDQPKRLLSARLKGLGKIRELFPGAKTQQECVALLRQRIGEFAAAAPIFSTELVDEAGEYLFHALAHDHQFAISREAEEIFTAFHDHLDLKAYQESFRRSLEEVRGDTFTAFSLARDWVEAFVLGRGGNGSEQADENAQYVEEVSLLLLEGKFDEGRVIHTPVTRDIDGMLGSHDVIHEGRYHLHFNRFHQRLSHYDRHVVPMYQQYTRRKHYLVETQRQQLGLEEFRPRVLTSFVRNRLIDEVYLPLVGDNLAKQMGAAGDDKRTDRMGLLLLISPPGYGKTTLMEYIANRLGLVFMKINGPAIGHRVMSLDPQEAPNASARDEVEKLNLALEMGDNVMIYVDDIQHCHAEFLQKFISLCDAQRKMEGVYKGRTQTYDLRGRKVCVVMAGNPYTESGEKFQIPDMLANRADTYNLGEIIGDSREAFELSYIENSLTSNPTLSHLARKSPGDVPAIVQMASVENYEPVQLEGNFSLDEVNEFVSVMKKLLYARDIVLKVNRQYIYSSAQADDYRTEPRFQLQGSYRNMNRIAERVSAIMNDKELDTLIYSLYENDAQTLTTGTEANLLKFKELMGTLNEQEARRWKDIQRTFQQNVRLRGIDQSDKFGQILGQMTIFSDGLQNIRDALTAGVQQLAADDAGQRRMDRIAEKLDAFTSGLDAICESLRGGLTEIRQQSGESREITTSLAPDTLQALAQMAGDIRHAEPIEPEEQRHKIHITNKVPSTIVAVIREQFDLMQSWLKPILEATNLQSATITQLKSQLDTSLEQYRRLMSEIDKAR